MCKYKHIHIYIYKINIWEERQLINPLLDSLLYSLYCYNRHSLLFFCFFQVLFRVKKLQEKNEKKNTVVK